MVTAIIGTGNIGKRVARDLVEGGQHVVLVGSNDANATSMAASLGALASASPVEAALDKSAAVLLAVWLDLRRRLLRATLRGYVSPDGKGGLTRTLPAGESAGAIVAQLLPPGAHYVKAFGTIAADELERFANRSPERVALLYATDDVIAERVIEELITSAGFDPVKAGGVADVGRIEAFGDLHQYGGFGKVVTAKEARAAIPMVIHQ